METHPWRHLHSKLRGSYLPHCWLLPIATTNVVHLLLPQLPTRSPCPHTNWGAWWRKLQCELYIHLTGASWNFGVGLLLSFPHYDAPPPIYTTPSDLEGREKEPCPRKMGGSRFVMNIFFKVKIETLQLFRLEFLTGNPAIWIGGGNGDLILEYGPDNLNHAEHTEQKGTLLHLESWRLAWKNKF